MVQEFGCSYLCLWLHSPQSLHSPNCLHYKNGFYIERRSSDQASSSYGTLAQRLFNEYKQSIFVLETSHIPGLAFQNNLPYTELNSEDLLTLAATETQRQFYQEAGIKSAVFMGCNAGEIEMGFSIDSQVNLEMQMRNWFPQDLITQVPLVAPPPPTAILPQTAHKNPTSTAASSSSSLRSLSYDDSTELYSPFLFDMIPTSSDYGASPETTTAAAALRPSSSSSAFTHQHQHQHQQAILQTLGDHIQSDIHTPSLIIESILGSLSSSSTLHATPNVPPPPPSAHTGTAFKRYRPSLGPRITVSTDRKRRQDMMKKSIVFLRNLNTVRAQQHIQANRPSTTQLHHMISERRRREKINGSFQALRSMLPPTTKKDKASVLASTTEYLSSLKDQVEELSKRNQILEAQLLSKTTTTTTASVSSRGTVDVQITNVGEPTSDQARTVDLHVVMIRNGENNRILDNVVVRLLEFLKLDQNVNLMSIEANTTVVDNSNTENRIVLRLRIEGSEWDERAFQEAVRRRIIN